MESEVIEAVAAEQEEQSKEEAVIASMPSEKEEAPSRQFVIHKAQSEGGEYKFSDNPIVAWFLRGNPLLKTGDCGAVSWFGVFAALWLPSGFMCRWSCVI